MLELCGSEYVIDHVICENDRREKELAYKIYVSDILKVMVNQWGADVGERYADWIKDEEPEQEEELTGDEIALAVLEKAGLKGRNNGLNEPSGEDFA